MPPNAAERDVHPRGAGAEEARRRTRIPPAPPRAASARRCHSRNRTASASDRQRRTENGAKPSTRSAPASSGERQAAAQRRRHASTCRRGGVAASRPAAPLARPAACGCGGCRRAGPGSGSRRAWSISPRLGRRPNACSTRPPTVSNSSSAKSRAEVLVEVGDLGLRLHAVAAVGFGDDVVLGSRRSRTRPRCRRRSARARPRW